VTLACLCSPRPSLRVLMQTPNYIPATPSSTSEAVTRSMRGNRRRDTVPERALRSALHARGYRFRVDQPIPIDGAKPRPDIVFSRHKLAIFIDGCFWHSCPCMAANLKATQTIGCRSSHEPANGIRPTRRRCDAPIGQWCESGSTSSSKTQFPRSKPCCGSLRPRLQALSVPPLLNHPQEARSLPPKTDVGLPNG
jgi:DNA mismatch endonuclease Vsr